MNQYAAAQMDRIKQRREREPSTLWCAAYQRGGNLKGVPCPQRASTQIDGIPYCGLHARLKPEGRRGSPAVGRQDKKKIVVAIRFAPESFEKVRDMAVEEGSSFAAMTRTLVDYALDDVALALGQNSTSGDV